jgi:tetratricopeptide (TPR) repeat protein
LEIDLNILIHYFKGDYVEKIIRYSDFMFTINPEVYKFIGRVLYNNKLQEQAMYFFCAAKNCFWNDPELHYQLAYIYYKENSFEKAQKSLENCLYILPEYFPATNLLRQIKN